jgi:hypothetical protein
MHAAKPESFYQNTKACYDNLVDLLTRARLEGLVPWEAITDTTRPVRQITFRNKIPTAGVLRRHRDAGAVGQKSTLTRAARRQILY